MQYVITFANVHGIIAGVPTLVEDGLAKSLVEANMAHFHEEDGSTHQQNTIDPAIMESEEIAESPPEPPVEDKPKKKAPVKPKKARVEEDKPVAKVSKEDEAVSE